MDGWPTVKHKTNTTHGNTTGALNNKRLSCMQIKLQHSWIAKDNLLKIMGEEKPDIICIQEPYITGGKLGGIPRSCTVLTAGEGKKRSAIPSFLPSFLLALQPWVSLGLLDNRSPLLPVLHLLCPLSYLHDL